MRWDIKVSTRVDKNEKKITTTKTQYISVRDIIGFASSGVAIAKALMAKKPDISIKMPSIVGLIAPLFALAMGLDIVQKVVQVIAIVTPIAQIAARASGIWAAPGNAADIIQIVMSTVSKILISLAILAFNALVQMILNMEFPLKPITEETSVRIGSELNNAGNKIQSTLQDQINNGPNLDGPPPMGIIPPVDTGDPSSNVNDNVTNGNTNNNPANGNGSGGPGSGSNEDGTLSDGDTYNDTEQIGGVGTGTDDAITGLDGNNNTHSFGSMNDIGNGWMIAGSDNNEGLWWSENGGKLWNHATFTHTGQLSDGNFKSFAYLNGIWYVGNNNESLQERVSPLSSLLSSTVDLRDATFNLILTSTNVPKTGFTTITYTDNNNVISGKKGDFSLIIENNKITLYKLPIDMYNFPLFSKNPDYLSSKSVNYDLSAKIFTFNINSGSNMAITTVYMANGSILVFSENSIKLNSIDIYKQNEIIDGENSTFEDLWLYNEETLNDIYNGNITHSYILENINYPSYTEMNEVSVIENAFVIDKIETIPDIKIIENGNVWQVLRYTIGSSYVIDDLILINNMLYKVVKDFDYNTDFVFNNEYIEYDLLNNFETIIEEYNTRYLDTIIGYDEIEQKIEYIIEEVNGSFKIDNDHEYIIKEFYNESNLLDIFGNSTYTYIKREGTGIFWSSNKGISWNRTNIVEFSWNGLATISDGTISRVIAVNESDSGAWYCNNGETTFIQSDLKSGSFHSIYTDNNLPTIQGIMAYVTNDVGLTWTLLHLHYFLCEIGINGRLIAGSGENTGLWYSDDNGINWIQSDQQIGNWQCLLYFNNLVDAGSADNRGIMYSLDLGETWKKTNVETGAYDFMEKGD